MTSLASRAGAVTLVVAAAAAALAPVLPLRDPAAQPDGLVLRCLPPGTRAIELAMADGSRRYASEARPAPDGSLDVRRGETWTRILPADLAAPAGRPEAAIRHPLYLLGTDGYGRDLLSRLVWGARASLTAGILAALVAVSLGGATGLTAGLAGGAVDGVLMRLTDGALAIPRLFLLVLVAALFRPSLATTILVIGGTTWMTATRLVRAEALSLRERDFVAAARSAGAGPIRVAWHHVLPASAAVLGVEAAVRLGQSVLLEASLSFLGLGVPPPTPAWGSVIADGRDRLLDAWWIATCPGVAIVVVVIAANLVADGLRDRP